MYRKLLEFYSVSFDLLSWNRVRLVLKMTLDNQRLPQIVQEFLKQATILRSIVQKATWEVVEDIKNMLYDSKSKPSSAPR